MADEETARSAAAAAAAERVEAGMTIGLGSGRAVWRVIELIAERFGDRPPVRAAFASNRTAELARAAGIETTEIDGRTRLDVAIDGADEIDGQLRLMKGGGGALLREKIVIANAERFVVVAEERKTVERIGERFPLPVEVVRFGWPDTRRRLLELLPAAEVRLRASAGGYVTEAYEQFITDEGHLLIDCRLPDDDDLERLGASIKGTLGVVEHGLFIGMADEVLLGRPDGSVDVRRI